MNDQHFFPSNMPEGNPARPSEDQPARPKLNWRRVSDVEPVELEWLWPWLIPLGKLSLFAGDPGLGKSFVTVDMAARVSRGAEWPDQPEVQQFPGRWNSGSSRENERF